MERCRECSGRRLAFASARAAVAYTGVARQLVRAWKERGLRPFDCLAAELVDQLVQRPAADVITYIPPDGDRSLRRGYHPPQRLARQLAGVWELDLRLLLTRQRRVERQTGLSREDRRANVRGAFVATSRVPGSVVLIDDVYTTGATVSAAATALRRSGARRVDVVTFARAVRH